MVEVGIGVEDRMGGAWSAAALFGWLVGRTQTPPLALQPLVRAGLLARTRGGAPHDANWPPLTKAYDTAWHASRRYAGALGRYSRSHMGTSDMAHGRLTRAQLERAIS